MDKKTSCTLGDETGSVVESYEYEAYGNTTVFDATGTELTTTMDINKIVFRARRFRVVGIFSLSIIPAIVLVKIMEHGLFPLSRIFYYIIEGIENRVRSRH